MRENCLTGCDYMENFDEVTDDSMKWYDHDDDMLSVSKIFPTVTFVLTGEGEERDDNWIAYYKDGEMEVCHGHIVYDTPMKDFTNNIWRY